MLAPKLARRLGRPSLLGGLRSLEASFMVCEDDNLSIFSSAGAPAIFLVEADLLVFARGRPSTTMLVAPDLRWLSRASACSNTRVDADLLRLARRWGRASESSEL